MMILKILEWIVAGVLGLSLAVTIGFIALFIFAWLIGCFRKTLRKDEENEKAD